MKLSEFSWLSLSSLSGAVGLHLIINGTGATTVGRYLIPPEILPGLGVLYMCAILTSVLIARKDNTTHFLMTMRNIVREKIGEAGRHKQRNMFLLLTILLVGFAMTNGTTAMYRVLATHYFASLLINLLTSMIAAIGLFGWLCSSILSKQSKDAI